MKNLKFIAASLAALIIVSCGTAQKNGTLIGAGGGAAVGALVGKLLGGGTKGTVLGATVGTAVGGVAGNLIGKHMDKVKAEAQKKLQNANVETITDENGLTAIKVTFDSGILFATNKSDLNATSKSELSNFATVLKNNADCSIAVWGHTDSTGNDKINNPLSVKRAESVANYLSSCGVAANQFKSITGWGSTKPVADNSTKAGQAQNRRVEVYLYASEEMIAAANAGTLK